MRMPTILTTAAAAVVLTAALAGCSTQAASTPTKSDHSTSASKAADAKLTGSFSGLNDKKVAGTVTISGDTITLADFSSDEGPDLHLYLANGTDEAAVTAGTEIDTVAWNKDAQTFTIPAGVDASRFSDVVVHCDKALAVFGAAAISK